MSDLAVHVTVTVTTGATIMIMCRQCRSRYSFLSSSPCRRVCCTNCGLVPLSHFLLCRLLFLVLLSSAGRPLTCLHCLLWLPTVRDLWLTISPDIVLTPNEEARSPQAPSPTLVYIWVYFNLIPNTIFLPLLVATFLISKTATRHLTLINACMTWIFSGIISCLLWASLLRLDLWH